MRPLGVLTKDETLYIIGLLTLIHTEKITLSRNGEAFPLNPGEQLAIQRLRQLLCYRGSVVAVIEP